MIRVTAATRKHYGFSPCDCYKALITLTPLVVVEYPNYGQPGFIPERPAYICFHCNKVLRGGEWAWTDVKEGC